MIDAPDLVTCQSCGKAAPIPEPRDLDVWHPVDCAGNAALATEEHRYWWRRRSNPVAGEEPLLEYSDFDPTVTADPKTVH